MIISQYSKIILLGEYRLVYEVGFNNCVFYNIYDKNGMIIYGDILK